MATKKITPANPDTEKKAKTDDKTASRTSSRKTALGKVHPRKMSRKTSLGHSGR